MPYNNPSPVKPASLTSSQRFLLLLSFIILILISILVYFSFNQTSNHPNNTNPNQTTPDSATSNPNLTPTQTPNDDTDPQPPPSLSVSDLTSSPFTDLPLQIDPPQQTPFGNFLRAQYNTLESAPLTYWQSLLQAASATNLSFNPNQYNWQQATSTEILNLNYGQIQQYNQSINFSLAATVQLNSTTPFTSLNPNSAATSPTIPNPDEEPTTSLLIITVWSYQLICPPDAANCDIIDVTTNTYLERPIL